jgi:single-strand DNA-binding protein
VNLNTVLIGGRLTHEPEITEVGAQSKKKARFSVAVNSGFGENKKTDYIDCEAWERQAENLAKARKGNTVIVVGRLEKQTWDDKETGAKRSKVVVKASQVDVLQDREPENPF